MSVQRQIDRLITFQAAEWFEALKSGDETINAAFVEWVSESPRHMAAFLAIASEAPMLRAALAQGEFDVGVLIEKVAPLVPSLPATSSMASRVPANRTWMQNRLTRWAAAAAAFALITLTALHLWLPSWQRFETPIGEQRAIQLDEGSIVSMNTHSRMDVRFDESEREIHLLRGEAMFKVAPDPQRPFRVHTPHGVVEAVGTQFNVYVRSPGTTAVAVLEGKVKLTSEHAATKHDTALAAGEQAEIGASGRIQHRAQADVTEAIAWQQRKLIFRRTTLEEMAMEFNRYNASVQIRLEGIEPEAFRYTGAFNADDPQSLAVLLSREPELSVERRGTTIVVKRR